MPKPPTPLPQVLHESVYIGIDIGKAKHVAGFVSSTLLQRHQRFEGCPTFIFTQSREGFHALRERIQSIAPLEHCFVLLEQTGHYHKLLEQYLLELDLPVYVMHVQRRPAGLLKTDKRDALGLAKHLYNQLEKGVQYAEPLQFVRRAFPPTGAAAQLKGLTRHRYELIHEQTQRKNQLTALCDELFPELTTIFKDPNVPTALAIRTKFPTPQALAMASFEEVKACRKGCRPSDADLRRLPLLAQASIGTKDRERQHGLVFEQTQLIRELQLLQEHLVTLDKEMKQVVEQSREGQIVLSIPSIGPLQGAAILATIGTIANFRSAGALKSYFGWAPILTQSGTTYNSASHTKCGSRIMKQMMYLIAWQAVRMETEWAKTYARLLPMKCSFDERLGVYKGRKKVLGRIAGSIICTIYTLLQTDYERLSHLAPGTPWPDPILYNAERHRHDRLGQYTSHRKEQNTNTIIWKQGS